MDLVQMKKSKFLVDLKADMKTLESLRKGNGKDQPPTDISLDKFLDMKHGISREAFYQDLGIDPSVDTIDMLFSNTGDTDIRWVVPEIIREALLVGLRTAPIWSNVTAEEAPTTGLSQTMPHINMSDAAPRRVGEAETIPLGAISYGQKKFSIYKVGRGIKIPYEVRQYTTLNVISIFLRDFGIKLGHALDVLAVDCLINGEQANGSESAPVIGVTTANTKTYADFLRIWIRASRMGRNFSTIIGGEAAALDTLNLTEFKTPVSGSPQKTLNMKTPLPSSANYFIHGNVPANQEILVDPAFALAKFNAQPLLVESEKIVSNQTEAFYATLTTGFAKIFRDAAVILDDSDTIGNLPFPDYFNIDSELNTVIE